MVSISPHNKKVLCPVLPHTCLAAWALSRYSDFLPQSRDTHGVRLIGNSKIDRRCECECEWFSVSMCLGKAPAHIQPHPHDAEVDKWKELAGWISYKKLL